MKEATMGGTRWLAGDHGSRIRATADEFRAESLLLVAGVAGLAALVWFVVLADPPRARTWLPPLLVLGGSALSVLLGRIRSSLGAVVLLGDMLAGTTVLLWNHPDRPAAFFYVAPVFAAGALLGPLGGLVVGILSSGLIAAAMLAPAAVLDSATGGAALVLVGLSVLLTWAAAHPVQAALVWAWDSYLDALRRSEELRDRQGELNRVLASLNETCYRLEVANEELARARAAADEARQLKAEFAANISHELRTPLNLIIGFSEILMETRAGEPALPPAVRADIDVIYRNARHLSNLIDDVLDLSQVDAGRMGLTKERVALTEIVREAMAAIARLYEARGLTLTDEVPADLPLVYVDRTRIRQVLINLLNNAARFTLAGGTTVRARQDGSNLVVEVSDTGVGIPPEQLPKMFEEFRQLDGTLRRPHEGSGLGLAICKRFVELHGGAIWAESQPGRGTTVFFTLPLIENVASAPLRPEWETWVRLPADDQPHPRTVVLISPDPQVERLFARYLDAYRVRPAADEAAALHLCAEGPAHGIILTAHPSADLTERLRRLRAVPRNLPLITCSLPSSGSISERLGVADYLVKPIAPERLRESLARVARRARVVLVVDDDPEMVRLLVRMIRGGSRRYQVLRAYGGRAALDLMRERRPDVVVLDLVMPDLDGYDVLREMRLRDDLRDIPVVAVTARGYETETIAAGALSITREGGLSVGELMACLRAALDTLTAGSSSAGVPPAAPAR